MAIFSPEVKDAVNELKSRVKLKDVSTNDLYENENLLYRFLKARDFDINSAEKMLKEHIEWRKKVNIEKILTMKHPEVLEKYLPMEKIGYDKDGCMVRYIPSGNIDWIGINASCKFEDLQKCVVAVYEGDLRENMQRSQELEKTLDKVVIIHNLQNLSFAQATDRKVVFSFIHLLNLYQNQYPETLKSLYAINASTYFTLLHSILKKFLPVAILQKVKIYSDDTYKEDFLKIIDADVLPAFLGGNRKDPDGNPLCLTFINHGAPVPEKYYIHKSKRSLANEQGVEKMTLARASFHEVVLEVKEPDSYLEWKFYMESRDIGFGLFYQDEEGNKTELVPLQRLDTDEYSESGIYKCEDVGTYIILFDNTYSIVRSKTIYHRIQVLTPKEAESLIQ